MGLDWGFSLKNKKDKNFNVDLISFGSWNTKETLAVIFNDFGKTIPENLIPDDFIDHQEENVKTGGYEYKYDEFYREVDIKKLLAWGEKLSKIKTIFAGISDRKIDEGDFTKKISEKYADLCYDLGIDYDEIIIFTLIRLANFIDFLAGSDLFEDYVESAKDNYLVVWQSY